MLCGTIGVSGGGWAHYVGQEALRPLAGWMTLTFARDWVRPVRQMNGTSFFYADSDQWRYEKLDVSGLLSPLADPAGYKGSFIDLNVRAERMGWLPSAPQLASNPLGLAGEAEKAGLEPRLIRRRGPQIGRVETFLRGPGQPRQFPAKSVHLGA